MELEAADIVAQLHGKCLRLASFHQSEHFKGLSVAAKSLFKDGRISAKWKRRLQDIDTAYHVTRHITLASSSSYFDELSQLLSQSPSGFDNYESDTSGSNIVSTSSNDERASSESAPEVTVPHDWAKGYVLSPPVETPPDPPLSSLVSEPNDVSHPGKISIGPIDDSKANTDVPLSQDHDYQELAIRSLRECLAFDFPKSRLLMRSADSVRKAGNEAQTQLSFHPDSVLMQGRPPVPTTDVSVQVENMSDVLSDRPDQPLPSDCSSRSEAMEQSIEERRVFPFGRTLNELEGFDHHRWDSDLVDLVAANAETPLGEIILAYFRAKRPS